MKSFFDSQIYDLNLVDNKRKRCKPQGSMVGMCMGCGVHPGHSLATPITISLFRNRLDFAISFVTHSLILQPTCECILVRFSMATDSSVNAHDDLHDICALLLFFVLIDH